MGVRVENLLKFLLGKKAEDCVTGITGVITSVTFDLFGCVQGLLTTQIDGSEKSFWYDICRLKVSVSDSPVLPVPNFEVILAEKEGDGPGTQLNGPANKPIP